MNPSLRYINLAGVLILAFVCVLQCRENQRVNLEASGLDKVRLEQSARLEEQARNLSGLNADLDAFRERLRTTSERTHETEARLTSLHREVRQITLERDQLKAGVTNWVAAVAARDERLGEFATKLQELAAGRNEAVDRFNALAVRHNTLVTNLNEARARLAALATNAAPARPAP